jgi:hypothetical protein
MSNVVSPRGPLPPRVYWRRRVVFCAVVVGLVLLVGRLFGGGDDTEPVADRSAPAGSSSATHSPAPTSKPTATAPGTKTPAKRTVSPRQVQRRAAESARTAELSGPTGPLAQPAGSCSPSDVAVVPDVEDTHALAAVPLRIGLSATGTRACTFDFGADSVALRVTSGDDLIWESLHCASALPEESVVVRPGWLSYVDVDWSGRRGSEGCSEGGDFAQPGYYWAEAAAVGGEPARSQFELTTPPKPEPRAKPTPRSGTEPGDGRPDSEQPTATETTKPSPDADERQQTHSRRTGG